MKYPLSNKLYYSISEVAELTALQPYILRAWEKEFACLRPRRMRGKNRAYRQRDIALILLIKRLLYEERFTIQGVRQKLKNNTELIREALGQGDGAEPESGENPEAHRDAGAEGAPPRSAFPPLAPPAGGIVKENQQILEEVKSQLRDILRLLS